MYYLDLFAALYNCKVRYLAIGGVAVSLHGVPRATQDVDIVISMERENVLNLISALKGLDYVPRLPVDPKDLADPDKVRAWVEDKNMKAFSFHHKKDSYKALDVVLAHTLDFDESFRNKTVKKVGNVEIYLASVEDLIKTKMASGRAQDLSDVEMLKRAKKHSEAP